MDRFHLPDHIHFCEIAGQRVFLDLISDRYFSLPPTTEGAFSAFLEGSVPSGLAIDAMAAAGLLISPPAGRPIAATSHPAPDRSLVEESASSRVSWSPLPEVLLLVLWARRAVAGRKLPRLLRPSGKRPASSAPSAQDARDDSVQTFRQVRRLVPVRPNCLYDSLALHRFLLRRSISADIVIGAKLHPFGAHCWLQDGTTVLNDTLAAARGFAPILVA